jgi:Domain of unknown function (DUF1929)
VPRTGPARALIPTILAAASLAAAPNAVAGHETGDLDSLPRGKAEERALRAYETGRLGPEHAREHAIQRRHLRKRIARWQRLTPRQRRGILARDRARSQRIARRSVATGDPGEVGRWTTAPFRIPNYAIHSVVLPTGKILFWGYPPFINGSRTNDGLATLWDPSKGTGGAAFKPVPPPLVDNDGDGDLETAPIYCSGQSFLPSGEVLVAGGNLVWPSEDGDAYDQFAGSNRVFTFDPWQETWTEQPLMENGRWYPTQVELADGSTAIVSGYSEDPPGGQYNRDFEVFTPGAAPGSVGSIARYPSADSDTSTYPVLFSMPNGSVLMAGGAKDDSAVLNTQAMTWQLVGQLSRNRDAGTGTLLPGGSPSTALQIGGYDLDTTPAPGNFYPATTSSESIDGSAGAPAWRSENPLNVGRANMNTVLLPDGSMVVVGGGSGYAASGLAGYVTHPDGSARQVELWDPATRGWRLGPAQLEDRAYHSTAILLPDGRVMSAGDDFNPSVGGAFSSFDTAEIYSPPYLFRKGKRPRIRSAPAEVTWSQIFRVKVKRQKVKKKRAGAAAKKRGRRVKPARVTRAVLMAPDATTHGVEMQARHLDLRVVRTVKRRRWVGLDVVAPRSAGAAPPGFYMLFVLDARGKPSVARWVKVTADPAPVRKKKRKRKRR